MHNSGIMFVWYNMVGLYSYCYTGRIGRSARCGESYSLKDGRWLINLLYTI